MIKRTLLFLALLAAGLFVLDLAVGGVVISRERPAAGQPPTADQEPRTAAADGGRPPGGIPLPGNVTQRSTGQVSVSIQGEFEYQRERAYDLADGTQLLLRTYHLHAKDSRPVPTADNLLELIGVQARMFRTRRESDHEPEEVLAAVLDATSVLVEIERDRQGRPSVQEDKEMDFRGVLFRTDAGSGVPAAELRVDRAKLRVADDRAHLRTDADEPFTFTVAGDRAMRLLGRGLDARLPTGDTPGDTEVRVVSQPVLTLDEAEATVVRAAGSMIYRERPDLTGSIELHDQVELTTAGGPAHPPLIARGDRLHGRLRRSREAGGERQQQAQWTWLHLVGAPATVDSGATRFACTALDLLPGLVGSEPALLSASGQPRLRLLADDGAETQFDAERRIHVLQLRNGFDRLVAPLGFARGPALARFDTLLIVAGRSSLRLPRPQGVLELQASDGLRALRSERRDGSLALVGQGVIHVELAEQQLAIDSEDGFVLHEQPATAGREVRIDIGREAEPVGFRLRRGELDIAGRGACTLYQLQDDRDPARSRGTLVVSSAAEDLRLALPRGEVRRVGSLRAEFDPAGLRSLRASGTACRIASTTRDGRELDGSAAAIASDDGLLFVLDGAPASLSVAGAGTLSGSRVELRTGAGLAATALGEARLTVETRSPDRGITTADLRAARVDLLPTMVPALPVRLHASYLPPAAARLFGGALLRACVHAVGDVTLALDAGGERSEAAADELWLQALGDDVGARLRGAPAVATARSGSRTTVGEARVIILRQTSGEVTVTLLPAADGVAALELVSAADAAAGPAAARDVRVECRAAIEIGPRRVRYFGPTVMTAAGASEPVVVRANQLDMVRDDDGSLRAVHATGGAVFESGGCRATAPSMHVDLRHTLLTLAGGQDEAHVRLPDGSLWRAKQIEFDYTSHAVRVWYGDVSSIGTR